MNVYFITNIQEGGTWKYVLDLIKYLNANKIGTRFLFSGNLIKQPYMKNVNFKVHGDLKNTDLVMKNTFWIGLYPGLSTEHLQYMVLKIKNFFKFFFF